MITTRETILEKIEQLTREMENSQLKLQALEQLIQQKEQYNAVIQEESYNVEEARQLKETITSIEHDVNPSKYAEHLVLGIRPDFSQFFSGVSVSGGGASHSSASMPAVPLESLTTDADQAQLLELRVVLAEMQAERSQVEQQLEDYDPKYFIVPEGQLTFDEEGIEGDPKKSATWRYHSRSPQVPAGSSGLTIGRGYDLRDRTAKEVVTDLTAVGLTQEEAEAYVCGRYRDERRAGEILS